MKAFRGILHATFSMSDLSRWMLYKHVSVCRGHRQGEGKEQTQTFNMQKMTSDDQEGDKRPKKASDNL